MLANVGRYLIQAVENFRRIVQVVSVEVIWPPALRAQMGFFLAWVLLFEELLEL